LPLDDVAHDGISLPDEDVTAIDVAVVIEVAGKRFHNTEGDIIEPIIEPPPQTRSERRIGSAIERSAEVVHTREDSERIIELGNKALDGINDKRACQRCSSEYVERIEIRSSSQFDNQFATC
jgi:hypothetical protein